MCKNMSRTRCHVIKIVNYCISKKMFWNSLFHCNLRGGARAAPTARFVGQLDGDHKRSEISVWEICSATRHVQGRIGLSGVREISRKAESLNLNKCKSEIWTGPVLSFPGRITLPHLPLDTVRQHQTFEMFFFLLNLI